MSNNRIDYTQWLKRGTSTFIPTDNAQTVEKIDSGVYNLRFAQGMGFYLFKKELKLDSLIDFDSKEIIEVMAGIEKFWEREYKFKEYGYIHKRGMLLYGPPGTGKTSLINLLVDRLIQQHNGVIFILSNRSDLDLYEQYIPEVFKVIEPDRKIITIIEDIDGFCNHTATETTLINILDGIEQSDKILYLATTNYPEKLPKRLMNRPNRFDRRIPIGWPSESVRRQYFEGKLHKEDLESIDLNKWIRETENMSIAHLGELIKSVIILDNDFDDTIKILKELKETPNSHAMEKGSNPTGKIGFGSSSSKQLLSESKSHPDPYEDTNAGEEIYYDEEDYGEETPDEGPVKSSDYYQSEGSVDRDY